MRQPDPAASRDAAHPASDGRLLGADPICPICRGSLEVASDLARCVGCAATFPCRDGIWDFLPPDRAAAFAPFLRDYRTVRAADGWGRADLASYRALPRVPPDDPQRAIWDQRAAAFATFLDRVVAPLEASHGRRLRVLDLGAGNGWLSHRLAERGHDLVAVDLSDDPADGLGAVVRFAVDVTPLRAEFDRLPVADRRADLIVFDAALHHAADCAAALREALRALAPGGRVVVLDSPTYYDRSSGVRMLHERAERHRLTFGIAATADQEGFLTWDRLAELADTLGLDWCVHWTVPAWRRALRRARADLRRQREPASFPIMVAAPRAHHPSAQERRP